MWTSGRRTVGVMLLGLGVGLVLCCSCAAKRDAKAIRAYEAELAPRVGQASVAEYVNAWGTPTQRIDLPDGTIYCWRIGRGARSGGVGYIVSYGESYERYDDLRLTFDKQGVLREYAVECLR